MSVRSSAGWVALSICFALAGCEQYKPPSSGGDSDNGLQLLSRYGCAACHAIPGIKSARGNVGPPLAGIARRVYLAGILPNTRANLMHWIRVPQAVDPLSGMPDLGVSEADALDMVAYLYRLD
jgi:cytochrome c2